ncbi:MAG TPA: serine/threonine-protein kinase, partial [Polyangia bacterium]
MIGTRIGNYEVKEKLGEGGMGAVYLGEHPLIGKRVAIKVLLEELVANEALVTRFFHEAKAANDIRHQNIVDIIDFGKIEKAGGGNIVYLVMELLEGQSLATRLDTKRLTFDEVRHVLQQCCSGLAASHAKGIIHRDLKPDNLFLVQRGGDDNF